MTSNSVQFGCFTLDFDRQCLRDTDGQIKLRPKCFDALRYLVENSGRLITKEELIEALWPNVTVTNESLTRCIFELRRAMNDDSQRIIKTVSKRGYLFDLPLSSGVESADTIVALEPLLPGRASIAVLPFANLSSDPEQDYLADGIVEDVITELSRFRELFVIARNSSFRYKGKAVDIRRVGRELGVRYVVEGTIRRSDRRVRVTVQLIDAESGAHHWAQKFDKDFTEIISLQDQISANIVGAIQPEILVREGARAARENPASLDAFDCCMRALWHYHQLTPDDNRKAQYWLHRSLEQDPRSAQSHSLLARVLAWSCWVGLSEDIAHDLKASLAAAERGIELDNRDVSGYFALSVASLMNRRHKDALAAAKRTIELGPSFAHGYFALGESLLFSGRFAEAIEPLERCLHLSPDDPFASVFMSLIALAHYHTGSYEESIEYSRSACQTRQTYIGLRVLAAALGQLGGIDEGRSVLIKMNSLKPREDQLALQAPYADPSYEAELVAGLETLT